MANFCEEIINQASNPKKIKYLFKTFTKSLKHTNQLWEIQLSNGMLIKAKNLILSSSLIAHPRCLKILKINSLPLRDAFVQGQDRIVDSLLRETRKLTYIKRKIYILYNKNLAVVKNFDHQYLQDIKYC